MTPYYQDDAVTIYHGDCREILPTLQPVDLVIADPPYAVKLDYMSYDDTVLLGFGWLTACRALAPCVVVTPGYVNTFKYPTPDYVAIRFDRTAQSPATIAWMNKWEPIFYYGKPPGRLPWDVLLTQSQSERAREKLDHPCPKPLSLYRQILAPLDSQTILDPFVGTGGTLRAAKDLGRKAIGIEIEERYCEIAAKRMAQEVLALHA